MTHVYERGQLVIPKYLRELLKWDAGTEVVMRAESHRLIIEKKISVVDELERFAKEANIKIAPNTDFDAEYAEGLRRKYKKMGLDL